MNIHIRPLQKADYHKINAIDVATQKQYLKNKWETMTELEKEEVLVTRRKDFLWHLTGGYCFVAELDSDICAFIYAYEIPHTDMVYIEYIAVNPLLQGKSIGNQLLQSLITYSKLHSIKKVWSLINTDNPQSMKAHQKAGFILKSRIEAEYCL